MVLATPKMTTKHAIAPAATSPTVLTLSCPIATATAVAPFLCSPTASSPSSRKFGQLFATSAPSHSSRAADPRLLADLSCSSSWRSALWPSSPVLHKKPQLRSTSNQSPSKVKTVSTSNNNSNSKSSNNLTQALERELLAPIPLVLKTHEPQDDDDGHDTDNRCGLNQLVRSSTLRNLIAMETPMPVLSVRLHGGDLRVQSAPRRTAPANKSTAASLDLASSPVEPPLMPLSPVQSVEVLAKRQSLEQELDEFCANADAKIVMFPDYFSAGDKQLVQQVAESLRLGCQLGERNVAVFKTGDACSDSNRGALPRARSRLSFGDGDAPGDDVFVNVSELAQQGKDCFIARLRLQRLSSGSGLRRNMLWDVAELTQSDDGLAADPVGDGDGGVYAMQSRASGQKLAMFKPAEEEKFVRDGLVPGEGAVREEAAYVLDSRSNGFSGVPPTAVARLQLSNIGRAKQGAVQRFMTSNIGSMEGFGMPFDLVKAEAFVPVDQVHRIGLLDVRVFNTDRHPGNILLIGDRAPYTMAPIDHGCILPSWFHLSEARFDWLEYPQCKVPFSANALEYIAALDAAADAQALRKLGIREECVTTLKICTLFLQHAAQAGRTLFWIGTFMQRAGCFETPSALELLVQQACVASNVPFTFVLSAFQEQKGSIAPGILSRRPPQAFFDALDALVRDAVVM